jgi:hypothetical protein
MTRGQRRTVIFGSVFVGFGIYTLWATSTGLQDSFEILKRPWGAQIFMDLAISVSLAWSFMGRHPSNRGQTFWPWLLLTLPLGSLSPLLFLTIKGIREWAEPDPPRV